MIRRLVRPAAVVLAVALGSAVGLVVAVLAYGRLPDDGAAAPVTVGVVVAVALGVLAAPALTRTLRSAVPALRRAPSEISRRIAELAAQRLPTDELLRRSAEALRSGLDSPRVEIWLRTEGGQLVRTMTLGVSTPAPQFGRTDLVAAARAGVAGEGWTRRWLPQLLPPDDDDTRRAPMRVGAMTDDGELLGLVVVGRRAGAPGYDFAEDDALGASCRMLAAILRNRALTVALEASLADLQRINDELAASRTRIVTAADAERRRIERDLHDGAQQHLLALAVTVGLLQQMVGEGDPAEDIQDVLGQLGDDVKVAVAELRALAQGIYPALLMDSGLEPALRAATNRAPIPVHLSAGTARRYPAGLEAAVYFCCLEALQNAAKHAGGGPVEVVLAERDGVLVIDVVDHGPGFDPTVPTRGMGRASMADRVGAHGGSVRWDATPGGGTTVHLEVPVPPGPPDASPDGPLDGPPGAAVAAGRAPA